MISSELFNRNLLALASRESRLSSILSLASLPEDIEFRQSRSGHTIPVIIKDGREFPLHSTFNPIKEANKFAQKYNTGGYIIFLGFGCGYQIEPFLNRQNVNNILIIDTKPAHLKAQLKTRDLRKIFLDPRVHFLIDASPEAVRNYLLSHCFPVLTGDIQVIPLRSRLDLEFDYFKSTFRTVKETLSLLADDFTVQTTFGKKWFINTISNLKYAENMKSILEPISNVVITAAGPSLEAGLEIIKSDKNSYIIATDTSYPALVKRNIRPDIIISIDCQHVSYHHFLSGFDPSIPLVLDLASPPALSRLTDTPLYFTSGHPFSIYLNKFWRKFPYIDTSGGNVTHAAISLAQYLGAKKIKLLGADFCYPAGKSYARGTYIYPYFHSCSTKFSPGESDFFNFVFDNKKLNKFRLGKETIYQTQPLKEYKQRLETTFNGSDLLIENLSPYIAFNKPGENNKLPIGNNLNNPRFFGAGPVYMDYREFIIKYTQDLMALPIPTNPVAGYFEKLSSEKRSLWLTLFPAAAAIRKQYSREVIDTAEILEKAYSWTLKVLQ